MSNIFSDNAMKYHELGYSVIPVNGKAPVVPNWPWYSKNPQTLEDIEALLSARLWSTGLGVVLGRGIFAIDIDTDDRRVLEMLPEASLVKRGKTGWTAIYRTGSGASGVDSKSDKIYPVELLATGRQTIMPPSIHPDTKTGYVWICEKLVPVAELTVVEDPAALYDRVVKFCAENKIYRTMKTGVDKRVLTAGVPNESPLGRGGRNNLLTAVAYRMCCDMKLDGLTVEDVAKNLLAYDERTFGKDAWFSDAKEHKDGGKLTALQRAVKFVERAMKSSTANGDMKPEYKFEVLADVVEEPVPEEVMDMMRPGFFEVPTVERYQALLERVPFLDAWSTYLVNESENYSPALTLGSGLTVLSACASNAFSFNDAAPNLYVMNVAPTGFGKDAPQRAVKRLLSKAETGGNEYLGFDSYDSSKGVLMNLAANTKRVRVDVQDEVSGLFEQLNFSVNNPHKITVENLCKLWSAGRSSIGRNAVMDKTKRITPVANPHLIWLGSTTPTGLQSLIDNQAAWDKGLVSRALFFIETRETGIRKKFIKRPGEIEVGAESDFAPIIIETIESTLGQPPELERSGHNLNQGGALIPILSKPITFNNDAAEFLDTHGQQIEALKTEFNALVPDGQMHPISVVLTRRLEMICRILASWFVGMGCEKTIDLEAVQWATEVMTLSQGSVVRYMKGIEQTVMEQIVMRMKVESGKRERKRNVKARITRHLKAVTGREPTPQMVQVFLREMIDDGLLKTSGFGEHFIWV